MMTAEEMVRHAKRRAYLLGYSAGERGRVSYADCPYPCAGDLREDWQEGYSDGRAGHPMRDDAKSGQG